MKIKILLIAILLIMVLGVTLYTDECFIKQKSLRYGLLNIQTEQINYQNNSNNKDVDLKSESTVPLQQHINSNTDSQGQISESLVSGQTTVVPWENDDKFKLAQASNDCNELMAAYRTVLRDPLPGEEYNVHLAARLLAGTIVNSGEIFSQNRRIGPYTEYRGFKRGPTYFGMQLITTTGGGVCKIASTLYNVTVLSNLQVVERYYHNMPVPYVPYGQDATVAYGVKDFKFKNNTSFPILIWAQGVDNVLYIGFYGKVKSSKVEWHHEMLKVYPARKVYRINRNLPAGAEKIILEGMDGGVVKSWVTIEHPDGTVRIKQLGKSYYNPMSYIIEKGK